MVVRLFSAFAAATLLLPAAASHAQNESGAQSQMIRDNLEVAKFTTFVGVIHSECSSMSEANLKWADETETVALGNLLDLGVDEGYIKGFLLLFRATAHMYQLSNNDFCEKGLAHLQKLASEDRN